MTNIRIHIIKGIRYVGNSQTMFAPTMQNGDEDVFFTYGINGSLRKKEVQTPNPYNEYFLFNSQANLKAYSDDIMSFAYYGYNAANTRTYKLSLYNTHLWINGQQQPLNMQLQNALFYPNTYLNFNQNGEYTKHYYNGMERIASRLGDNTTTIALNSNILEERKLQLEEQFREDIHKLIEETVPIDMPPFIDVNTLQPTGTPNDIYYYHPNHLGNTAFITDDNATITQGFLYAPFGEITTEYNINFGNNTIPKYAFNAKELDEETGMYYYESRYYKPPVFTSKDPMFEKYFWMSPYAYCANNPVKYVDPDGEEMSPIYDHDGNFLGTDNQGLQGEAIIMDRSDFKQNMSHEEALAKKKETFKSFDAYSKYYSHFLNLPNRPDYDGVVTKEEADAWWNAGTGEPLYVDLSKIDLPGVTTKNFSEEKQIGKNFLWNDLTGITGTTYGSLTLTLLNPITGEVKIGNDERVDRYKFDMQKGRPLRNIATFMGRPGGTGVDFNIVGYGSKYVPVK